MTMLTISNNFNFRSEGKHFMKITWLKKLVIRKNFLIVALYPLVRWIFILTNHSYCSTHIKYQCVAKLQNKDHGPVNDIISYWSEGYNRTLIIDS